MRQVVAAAVQRGAARIAVVLGLTAALPAPATGQRLTRPDEPWVTLETQHFRVHAPRELSAWARSVADRLDAVRERTRAAVGFVPPGRTDVVVDDPYNDPNGSAYPFLRAPAVFLWPVPPSPRLSIGHSRNWGEELAVHEFAHVAHLARPSRNRWQRVWREVLPPYLGPVATRSPRWAIEGYATYIEGALTGSGRPHAAQRAAVLRGWALEGALPSYGAVNGGGGYIGGSFAYLMGSAFLEYLGGREGDSSLTAVWRRVSARTNRSFDAAFAGVYGEAPSTLYRRFTAQLTADAFALQARVDSAGRTEGTLVQRLAYGTGDPAVSPDGRRLAVALGATPAGPSRLVVWRLGADAARDTAADSAEARARRRLLRRDPEDVAAVRRFPRPLPTAAVLLAVNGRAHADPRFLPDGRRVLVTRDEPAAGDVYRPDLFVWDTRTGALRRVTRGAGVREADPAPNGREAAAVRCAAGRCDIVRVDLATGAVATLARGAFDVTWSRPRWSPDGSRVVSAVQRGGVWRIALIDPATGAVTEVSPDDGASRYDVSFEREGRAILYTSEAGGVPNVVRLELGPDGTGGAERPLTRTVTAAYAPAASAAERAVYFLHLTPHGLDLRRVSPDSAPVRGPTVALLAAPSLLVRDSVAGVRAAAAQRPPVAADTFAVNLVRERAYGVGPRRYSAVPLGTVSPDGGASGVQVAALDPAGRLGVLAQFTVGDPRPWQGGALRAAWRGLPATVVGELFAVRQELGGDAPNAGVILPPELAASNRYRGATLLASGARWLRPPARGVGPAPAAGDTAPVRARPVVGPRSAAADVRLSGRVGVHAGHGSAEAVGDRLLAFGELGVSTFGARALSSAGVSAGVQAASGATGGRQWRRAVASSRASLGGARLAVALDATYAVVNRAAPIYEQPLIGGPGPSLFDAAAFGQRLAVPALPTGFRGGRQAAVARASLAGVGAYGFTPFGAAVSAGERLGSWARIAGLERRFVGPFAPFARLPQSRIVAGVARVFDAPLAGRTRGYLTVTFTP